jgi:hypothetical protein
MPFAIRDRDALFKVSARDIHENGVPVAIHTEGIDLKLYKVFASAGLALGEVQILNVASAFDFPSVYFSIHFLPP